MEMGRGGRTTLPTPIGLEPLMIPFTWESATCSGSSRPLRNEGGYSSIGDLRCIQIKPSRDDQGTLEVAEQLLVSLPISRPVAFEVIGQAGRICFQMVASGDEVPIIVSQLNHYYPGSEAFLTPSDRLREIQQGIHVARAYRLKNSHFFPLGMARNVQDPFYALCGTMTCNAPHPVMLQILFTPATKNWKENMRAASRDRFDPTQSPFYDLPHLPKVVDQKVAKPLFAVSIRMAASHERVLAALDRFFTQFETLENGMIPVDGPYPLESIFNRTTHVQGTILNTAELSYFCHLPSARLLEGVPAIACAAKSYPLPERFTTEGPILGYHMHQGMRKSVHHIPYLTNQHGYISGRSGSGKTNLLLYQILQRIERGDGVGVIDPHGILIERGILPRIPRSRVEDVIYLNAGDFEYPMALNYLAHGETKLEREHIRVDLLNLFEDICESPLGVNVQHALNFLIITLLSRTNSTLADMERLLIDKEWRKTFLKGITDERILAFWEREYPMLEKRGALTWITNKLSPLLLPDSTIGPMLIQRENSIDFSEIMDTKKIFLCNLSHGDIGKRNSQLLGKLVTSKIQIGALMRKRQEQPADFYLYLDECQYFCVPSMSDILNGARKQGLHLWLANQSMGDISDSILRNVYNASTFIFFSTDAPQEQALIDKVLSHKVKASELGHLAKGQAFVKMDGSVFHLTTEKVADPPPGQWENEIRAASRDTYCVRKPQSPTLHPLPDTSPMESIPQLDTEEKSFLDTIYRNPTHSVTKLYRQATLSAFKGDKLKTNLLKKSFIKEVKTHLGMGSRIAKFLILTPLGFDALDITYGPQDGKGGTMHRYFQSVIREYSERMGYHVTIEDPIAGSMETVDIGLEKEGRRTAIEISITSLSEHELKNTQKCLRAGYHRVIVLMLEEKKVTELTMLLESSLPQESRTKVQVGLVYGFCDFLK